MVPGQASSGDHRPGYATKGDREVDAAPSSAEKLEFPPRVGLIAEPIGFQPVRQESTASIIARQLRNAIAYGTLPPGSQLGEADLAARFQVSRGPLREAMQRLVQEGLLRSSPNRGLFVISLSPQDVRDIYTTRITIECAAVSLILQGDHAATADRLDRAIDQIRETALTNDNPDALIDEELRFHEQLVTESGSARLIRVHGTLLVESRMCVTALQPPHPPAREMLHEHLHLIQALRAGDKRRVIELIVIHLTDAMNSLSVNGRR